MQTSPRALLALLACVLVSTAGVGHAQTSRPVKEDTTKTTDSPRPMREFRGVWVATVGNIDWPSSKSLTTDQQKAEIIAILDRCKQLNLNAVVFQARPSCDALYDSKLEPWSEFLTGQQGKAPEPYYDPLQMWVEESHKRGIELHVWFNPYRARSSSAKGELAANHLKNTHPDVVKDYGKNQMWLDPGEKFVQDHSLAVMLDVVKRYDIDGVHMDDYFYPYKEKGPDGKVMDFPDEPSWKKYQESGGKLSRDDWRRSNVDNFVQKLYAGVKKEKPWVKVGISPFGIWQPGYPAEVHTKFSQYGELYADAKKWLNKGWVDYFTPQLYWKISSPQPYPYLLRWWLEENTENRHIWPGLYTSRVGSSEAGSFGVEEIVNQIVITRFLAANGNVHFSMKPFMTNKGKINDVLTTSGGVYAQQALIPACPWLGFATPSKPKLETAAAEGATSGPVKVKWTPVGEKAWQWAVYTKKAGEWTMHVLPGAETAFDVPEGVSDVAVAGVDRNSNEGQRATLKMASVKPAAAKAEEKGNGQVQ